MILMTPADIYEQLTKKIDLKRKTLFLTQVELAKKAGVSTRTYQSLLEGKPISARNLLSLMYALGLDDELESLATATTPKSTDEILHIRATQSRQRVRKSTKVHL